MLSLTIRPDEPLHIGDAVIRVENAVKDFLVFVEAPRESSVRINDYQFKPTRSAVQCLGLLLRPGSTLHIGSAEIQFERNGRSFRAFIKAPLSVHVFRERVLENMRKVLAGKDGE